MRASGAYTRAAWVVVAACVATPALPRATRVTPRHPGVLAEAVGAAASDDTLFLAPGTYTENGIAVAAGALTIIGEGNLGAVVLDGGNQPADFPMIRSAGGRDLTLERLTIRGVNLNQQPNSVVAGASLSWQSGGHVALDLCVFEQNRAAVDHGDLTSGGVVLLSCAEVEVTDCRFADNTGGACPASELWVGYSDRVTIRRSTFESTGLQVGSLSELWIEASGTVALEDSRIAFFDTPHACSGGAYIDALQADVSGNEFGAGLCDFVLLVESKAKQSVDSSIRSNRFWSTRPESNARVSVSPGASGTTEISENTFWGVGLFRAREGRGSIHNNVVSDGVLSLGAETDLSCNVVWRGHVFVAGAVDVDTSSVIHADPLFCYAEGGDFNVRPESICLPGNNVACGAIGWGREGNCVQVPVARTSWGELKWAFRAGSWARRK